MADFRQHLFVGMNQFSLSWMNPFIFKMVS
jgi:hypothetical protein